MVSISSVPGHHKEECDTLKPWQLIIVIITL